MVVLLGGASFAGATLCENFVEADCNGSITDRGPCRWDHASSTCETDGADLPEGTVAMTSLDGIDGGIDGGILLELYQRASRSLAISFSIQLVGWLLASRLQTSRFYDMFGSLTFLLVTLALPNQSHASALMAVVWCSRLGTFLSYRALKHGEDPRFESIIGNPLRFGVAWFLQGVWVVICLLPVILRAHRPSADASECSSIAGVALFLGGFVLEVTADFQKWRFKQDPANAKRSIERGVWQAVRYPNYAGEIVLWMGVALTATTDTTDAVQLALSYLSPAFVAFLLVFVSGIPPQEARRRRSASASASAPARRGGRDRRAKLVPGVW